jgi:hypothetical protein
MNPEKLDEFKNELNNPNSAINLFCIFIFMVLIYCIHIPAHWIVRKIILPDYKKVWVVDTVYKPKYDQNSYIFGKDIIEVDLNEFVADGVHSFSNAKIEVGGENGVLVSSSSKPAKDSISDQLEYNVGVLKFALPFKYRDIFDTTLLFSFSAVFNYAEKVDSRHYSYFCKPISGNGILRIGNELSYKKYKQSLIVTRLIFGSASFFFLLFYYIIPGIRNHLLKFYLIV